eukprot:GSChrysophyteH1.ASY1.ANO1.2202.1 assembled CDS
MSTDDVFESPEQNESTDRVKKGATGEGLAKQNLETLDQSKLTPLTPEVISRQATINIGTIGHVAHVRFKNELIRNITIKLGYANAKIYKCDGDADVPGNYRSKGSSTPDEFTEDGKVWRLLRHVSFVDCPGHDILMATMLNGAAVMDAALLLIAGNEPCPQPQTSEHLAAVEIMRLKNIIILQNKVDLVKPEAAEAQQDQIRKFVAATVADSAPIIPISAVLKFNIDLVAEYIARYLPIPSRDFISVPRLIVIRSFDVNKPGEDAASLRGGVAGGSILQGVLRVGDEIEVRPGIVTKDSDGNMTCTPIFSRIMSLYAESNDLQYAVPGGLIGVGTKIDPTLTRADRLVGQVLGLRDNLPRQGAKQARVARLEANETLMVNIGSVSAGGKVLTQPVCTQENEKIALSRRVDKYWRLIGWGEIKKGKSIAAAASKRD